MTIGDVPAASAASSINVKLAKSQGDQQAQVVDKLIDSTAASAPRCEGCTGQRLNVVG